MRTEGSKGTVRISWEGTGYRKDIQGDFSDKQCKRDRETKGAAHSSETDEARERTRHKMAERERDGRERHGLCARCLRFSLFPGVGPIPRPDRAGRL